MNKFDLKDANLNEINVLYFIHIPKTSGQSLKKNKIINYQGHKFNVGNAYRTPKEKKGYPLWESCYFEKYNYPNINSLKITIIRNPFDLLCSYYHHNGRKINYKNFETSGWASVNYTHNFKSFSQFINSYASPDFIWHVPLLKKNIFSQIFNEKNECVVDIIIKYEFLNDSIKILNKYLPKNKQLMINNFINITNNKKNYKEYYNKDMIKLIEKKCNNELKLFNYNFEGSINYEPLILNFNKKIKII